MRIVKLFERLLFSGNLVAWCGLIFRIDKKKNEIVQIKSMKDFIV